MIQKAFIIHGTYGHPDENWFPWLKRQLVLRDIETIIPAFPTPENQSRETWQNVMAPYLPSIGHDTILIGHSLGAPFILGLLNDADITPAACFLACPFTGTLQHQEIDNLNASITVRDFDWARIRSRCPLFHAYYSDNDPYVPQSVSQTVARNLNAKEHCMPNGGHLNATAGYTEFPLLLDHILAL